MLGPNCGTEIQNELVLGSQTGCSSPVELGTWIFVCTAAPVLAFTRVPNAGVSALLATSTRFLVGEYAISSTRNVPPVLSGGNCVGGGWLGLEMLNERSRLQLFGQVRPPSPANSVCCDPLLTVTTPSGPETLVPPIAAGIWPANTDSVRPKKLVPAKTSTAALERSAT